MYASIQSHQFPAFYCRVLLEPIIKNEEYTVYKLAGHGAEINENVKGIHVGKFDHIATDKHGNVHLFDIRKCACVGNFGLCDFIPDGPNGPGSNQ